MRDEFRYIVTGATGNVGYETVRSLLSSGVAVRAAVRHPEGLTDRITDNPDRLEARCLGFDGSPPESTLFDGADGILLVRPPQIGDVESLMFPFLRAARQAGVTRIVFLSLLGAQWLPFLPHRKLEKEIQRLGFDYTFIRAGFFMQNLEDVFREFIRDEDELPVPAGESRTSFVDARDLGEAAARLLLTSGPTPTAVRLTGAQALTYHDVARVLSEALARKISYTKPTSRAFEARAAEAGWDRNYITVVSRLFITVRLGMARKVTNDLEQLLGRPARHLEEYVADRKELWQPPAANSRPDART